MLKNLIKLYKSEVIEKPEGKLIDLIGEYTVYVHFKEINNENLTVFYVNEQDKVVRYDKLCSLSSNLISTLSKNAPSSEISRICDEAMPRNSAVSALFIIGYAGHSFISKVNRHNKYMSDHEIQIGGFISAILSFSKEVVQNESRACLKSINFGDQQLCIAVKENVIIAYVVDGDADTDQIERYVNLIIEEFLEQFSERIEDFSGDLTPFCEFENIIDNYFVI